MTRVKSCSNSYYQGLVQDLYSGKDGEFVCFMQMFYQANCCKLSRKSIDLFERLAKKELKICEILSCLLQKFGCDWQYCSSAKRFVSGKDVAFVKDFKKMLMLDIELFETAIVNIKNSISKIEDCEIRANLKKILVIKKESLNILKEEYIRI